MHAHDGVEVLDGHVPKRAVPDDAGVVDHDVDRPQVDGLIDKVLGLLLIADVAVVGDRRAAPLADEGDGGVGVAARAFAVDRRTEIVDDHLGPVLGQLEGVTPADPVTGTGHDGDLSLQQTGHLRRLRHDKWLDCAKHASGAADAATHYRGRRRGQAGQGGTDDCGQRLGFGRQVGSRRRGRIGDRAGFRLAARRRRRPTWSWRTWTRSGRPGSEMRWPMGASRPSRCRVTSPWRARRSRSSSATELLGGQLDVVINIVGFAAWADIMDIDDATWQLDISRNLTQHLYVGRAAGRQMIEQGTGGRIALVASVSGIYGAPNHGAYGAAKAGAMDLVRTMAQEWGHHGIRVNAVAPDMIATPRVRGHLRGHGRGSDRAGPQGAGDPRPLR